MRRGRPPSEKSVSDPDIAGEREFVELYAEPRTAFLEWLEALRASDDPEDAAAAEKQLAMYRKIRGAMDRRGSNQS